ncbi:DUF6156 family protein [Rhodoblastus acidophilus]|uniref:DUF6156 family protein n=1 Tax=Candidatus Rhodoblastus alkanivorans TaxID=2954117 RepID=A0ABS9Z435_9HYPH|nr:DUF6156 family protein [Candidatus Rhodoblastus alkanivorans]MCI4679242.1 DUF6156 family protein [Candidatus Rhodoblastus alkanivorans]MCI4682434.1 DUF6156 family protein [Candidatus Rhodoblastus alkanivorans]MDI4639740.1 DUF6156 family protein [Rhodoblastus acidophilus]
MSENENNCRYFLATSGVKLPMKLVNEIEPDALSNRNTFFRAYYDASGLLLRFEKMVYGDVELSHRYEYDAAGALRRAEIVMLDEEPTILEFNGAPA